MTSYPVHIERTEGMWRLTMPGGAVATVAHMREIEPTARDLIAADATITHPSRIDLDLRWPAEITESLATAERYKEQAAELSAKAVAARAELARHLHEDYGETLADLGVLFNVGRARAHAILNGNVRP